MIILWLFHYYFNEIIFFIILCFFNLITYFFSKNSKKADLLNRLSKVCFYTLNISFFFTCGKIEFATISPCSLKYILAKFTISLLGIIYLLLFYNILPSLLISNTTNLYGLIPHFNAKSIIIFLSLVSGGNENSDKHFSINIPKILSRQQKSSNQL